ncbi:uncharacterized protein EHS24_005072 [Apiotrichum porosum]|uniref:Uncharacterized protein n=1 Tax=Apiotrichum porosum TaxID=105984 RepID=A0A427Y6T0_9TREE|nr:uncharacterized protein EHS24_005072 [Apiotrichum porosum]RSH86799.1 hypothetical protein EHS24_005072 [Apiotrichum porosum]
MPRPAPDYIKRMENTCNCPEDQLQFILPIGFMIYQRNSEFMRYHSMRSPDPNATDVANLAPILEVEMPFALEGYGIPGNQAEQYSQLYLNHMRHSGWGRWDQQGPWPTPPPPPLPAPPPRRKRSCVVM